jgi:putative transposase
MKTIHRAYKYRFYPTNEQKELLAKTFGSVRYVWNTILDWRSKEYTQNQTKINFVLSSKKLTEIKKDIEWLNEVSSVAIQQTLRDQDVAFSNFFAKRGKYPNFKSKRSNQSFRLVSSGFTFRDEVLKIAKSKQPLKVKWSRKIKGEVSSITISKDSVDRYFVSMLSEEAIEPKPMSTKAVGIDLGLTDFAITSDGIKYKPLKATIKYQDKLKKLQRRLSKKQHSKYKGDTTPKSKNYIKAQKKVAKVHAKIADCRNDFLQKLSTKLIRENQIICLEDLSPTNMLKNRKLSKHIADASWSKFVTMLQYKADWYGRTLSFVSPWFPSSQICSHCGARDGKKPLSVRKWICPHCGVSLDRDVNASKNILTAGLAGLACGDGNTRDLTA